MINIGSQYNYGNADHAEFLCVVSRELGATTNCKETEPTDRAKVSACFGIDSIYVDKTFKVHSFRIAASQSFDSFNFI